MPSQSTWDLFVALNLSFPVVCFTLFLSLLMIYWCVAAFGLIDIDVLDADTDVDAQPDAGAVSGLLMRLGLNGVPITIIITLIAFWGWLISLLTVHYLMPLIPTLILKMAFALGLLLFALYAATMITALTIKPIRPYFLTINAEKPVVTIGATALVRTGMVNEDFGEAYINDGGAGLIVKVRSYPGDTFKKDDRVVLIDHDPVLNVYKVISEQEHNNGFSK